MPPLKKALRRALLDVILVSISAAVAILLYKGGVFHEVLAQSREWQIIGTIISGFFFTSIFTTPLAIASIVELSGEVSLPVLVFLGAMGAVLGDMVLYLFVRKRISNDVGLLCRTHTFGKVCLILEKPTFRFLTPLIGGIIIASPFPDEIGLTLLGLSRLKTSLIIPLSFLFNGAGILAIGLLARASI